MRHGHHYVRVLTDYSYWDNVGGESLEAAIEYSAQQAHFIVRTLIPIAHPPRIHHRRLDAQICGSISNYNTKEPYNVKNLQLILWRELTFHGFLVFRLEAKYADEFFRTFPARVASGEIKFKEHVERGLEHGPQAIVDVHLGKNFGKSVLVISDE